MTDILVGFGDSWARGDELDRPEENSYLALLGKQLHCLCSLGIQRVGINITAG
jgi:hypothetical protein